MVKAIIKIGHEYYITNEYANEEMIQALFNMAFKTSPHNARIFILKLKRLAGYRVVKERIYDDRTHSAECTTSKIIEAYKNDSSFSVLYDVDIINKSYTCKNLK